MAKRRINEFAPDHAEGFVPEPVMVGDPHGNRSADVANQGPPEQVHFNTPESAAGFEAAASVSKATMVAQILDAALKMKNDELVGLLSKVFDDSGSASNAVGSWQNNLASLKGNPAAQQPALDNGSVAMAMAVTNGVGDNTAHPNPGLPAADPSRLAAEAVDEIFVGTELSEETKMKFKVLFESAINIKASLVEAELMDEYQEKLEEGVETAIQMIAEKVNLYLTRTAREYVSENKIALVDTARLAISENFLSKFKSLIEESYIEVSDEDVSLVSEAMNQVQIAEEAADELFEKIATLEEDLKKAKKDLVLEQVTNGLSATDRQKLVELSESVSYEDEETYTKKITLLKEEKVVKPNLKPASIINEKRFIGGAVLTEEENQVVSPDKGMQRLIDMMKQSIENKNY